MYKPRPLEDLHPGVGPFWLYRGGEWLMASITWRDGRPSRVSLAPGLPTASWEDCRSLPAIAIATAGASSSKIARPHLQSVDMQVADEDVSRRDARGLRLAAIGGRAAPMKLVAAPVRQRERAVTTADAGELRG